MALGDLGRQFEAIAGSGDEHLEGVAEAEGDALVVITQAEVAPAPAAHGAVALHGLGFGV